MRLGTSNEEEKDGGVKSPESVNSTAPCVVEVQQHQYANEGRETSKSLCSLRAVSLLVRNRFHHFADINDESQKRFHPGFLRFLQNYLASRLDKPKKVE
jgi:hypothetical protein